MLDGQVEIVPRNVDETETRRAVRLIFELYRKRKRLLAMEMVPHPEPASAVKGYANAMDPKFIHGNRVNPSSPINDSLSPDARRKIWCQSVEHTVECLQMYEKLIIKHCYMHDNELRDDEVQAKLESLGWKYGDTYYYSHKERAVMELAEAWRCMKFK